MKIRNDNGHGNSFQKIRPTPPSGAPPPPSKIIDCHVHLAALSEGTNGCYVSRKTLASPLFRYLTWKHGLDAKHPRQANQQYVNDLLKELRRSTFVGKVVLLGMDGVYDAGGRFDQSATHFLVGNDYVLQTARAYPREFLPGVSINPQRRDAVDELHRCAEAGAALVKVLPNTQQFDPAAARYKALYRVMAQRRIPLLSHVGYEWSLIGKDQSLGNPDRLRVALDEGVTVIAAHACSSGLTFRETYHSTLLALAGTYPRFYADISALTLPNRVKMLLLLREHPEIHDRLLFGTDYPLSVFHLPVWGRIERSAWRDIVTTNNRFDKQFKICRSLGIHFLSFGQLLRD